MNKEIVSVIIPCYNQGEYLRDAINSVLNQTYTFYEIIVVDDGSLDNIKEITDHYLEVKLIQQPNCGVAIARNNGIQASNGSYLIFLDSDDRLLPNALEEGVRYLNKNQNCAYVTGLVQLIDSYGKFINIPSQPIIENDHFKVLLRSNYIWTPGAVMYRKAVFSIHKGFDTSAGGSADYELNIRIARTELIGCHGQVILEYRKHSTSMSKNSGYMLKSGVIVRNANVHFVKHDAKLYSAWEEGIRIIQEDLGGKLLKQIEDKLQNKVPRKDLARDIWYIVKYYPNGRKGLVDILKGCKLYNLLKW